MEWDNIPFFQQSFIYWEALQMMNKRVKRRRKIHVFIKYWEAKGRSVPEKHTPIGWWRNSWLTCPVSMQEIVCCLKVKRWSCGGHCNYVASLYTVSTNHPFDILKWNNVRYSACFPFQHELWLKYCLYQFKSFALNVQNIRVLGIKSPTLGEPFTVNNLLISQKQQQQKNSDLLICAANFCLVSGA